MGYPPRIQLADALYHVTARGVDRQPIVRDDRDRRSWIARLAGAVRRLRVDLHAFCLMDNHYHLLLATPRGNLAQMMQGLNAGYALAFNRRHGRVGHLFQGRYHSILIEEERHLLEVARYIVLNPVRAAICKRPEDWEWSSYRSTVGLDRPQPFLTVGWLHSFFGRDVDAAQQEYGQFVADGCSAPTLEALLATAA